MSQVANTVAKLRTLAVELAYMDKMALKTTLEKFAAELDEIDTELDSEWVHKDTVKETETELDQKREEIKELNAKLAQIREIA
jgi:predicted RNase H-like nuclease (RuvC/YqgF family)